MTTSHYEALKKLMPVNNLDGILDDDLIIEGAKLDEVYTQAQSLLPELFPDTSSVLLASWYKTYNVTNSTQLANRFQDLANKVGFLSAIYITKVALDLGYTISIVEGNVNFFIIGDSSYPFASTLDATDDKSYDGVTSVRLWETSAIYEWTCYAAGSLDPADQARFQLAIYGVMPAFTKVTFIFS